MPVTTPPTITALPAPPDPNDRATFNTRAYPWSVAQQTLATEVGAVAANVKANADDAAESATLADADRVQTGLDRVETAADRVQTGLDRAQTVLDAAATAADRVQTGLDATATADDRAAVNSALASIAGGPVASVNGLTGAVTGVVDLNSGQTLTNKVLGGATNNVEARSLKTATTTVSLSTASAPTSGQVLTAIDGSSASWQNTQTSSVGNHEIRVCAGNGYGSTNNKIRRFTTTLTSAGTAITYADSATLGASFTINEAGLYAITYTESAWTPSLVGVSVNSTQLSTSIGVISSATRIAIAGGDGSDTHCVARVIRLSINDVVRAHTDAASGSSSDITSFSIVKVGV